MSGFRVFNAAGAQVTGFSMTPSGTISEFAPVPAARCARSSTTTRRYGFYFLTSLALEIADLDSGKTPGWQRTGQSFDVYASAGTGRAAVCRFYGVFGPKSSHFYAPRGLGCEALLPTNPVWQYEGEVFYTFLPDANGACPPGNVPVYRLYNNGQGGAPNHRFTTSAAIQAQMVGEGWIPEGTGTGVGMCSPKPSDPASPSARAVIAATIAASLHAAPSVWRRANSWTPSAASKLRTHLRDQPRLVDLAHDARAHLRVGGPEQECRGGRIATSPR